MAGFSLQTNVQELVIGVPRDPGVRVLARMGILRRSAALMRPPFSFRAQKVFYALKRRTGGNWRKLVKSFREATFYTIIGQIFSENSFIQNSLVWIGKYYFRSLIIPNRCFLCHPHARKSQHLFLCYFDWCANAARVFSLMHTYISYRNNAL